MKATYVEALPGYQIRVRFEDNISGIIDLKTLIQKGIFTALQDNELFKRVYLTDSAIAWSDELEIDLLTVYSDITGKNPRIY
ncbi:MAG: DUF2442 domain-containing protein [Taibaiella sp.]|nr:DUF2442 domain-containing protein [Taibaiella sp.]